jgi:hypothetical protein
MESDLTRIIQQQVGPSNNVDVAYEFPFYPYREGAWVTIQFHSSFKRAEEISELVLSRLNALQKKSISMKHLKKVQTLHAQSEDYWLHENTYWIRTLTNDFLWKWDRQKQVQQQLNGELSKEDFQEGMNAFFDLNHVTRITTK